MTIAYMGPTTDLFPTKTTPMPVNILHDKAAALKEKKHNKLFVSW